MNTCKQDSPVKLVRCPRFRKRLSESEFRDLVGELDQAEARAAELERKVKDLIDRAQSGRLNDRPGHASSPGDPD
jgi:TATA-binding protein-associated factor Taf7